MVLVGQPACKNTETIPKILLTQSNSAQTTG